MADDVPRSHGHSTCVVCLEHLFDSKGREASQRRVSCVYSWILACNVAHMFVFCGLVNDLYIVLMRWIERVLSY